MAPAGADLHEGCDRGRRDGSLSGQVERHPGLRTVVFHLAREPAPLEHPDHATIRGRHERVEHVDPEAERDPGKVREEQAADSSALPLIEDDERDLCPARLRPRIDEVAREPHDSLLPLDPDGGHEPDVDVRVDRDLLHDLPGGQARLQPTPALTDRLGRELGEALREQPAVIGPDRADVDERPIPGLVGCGVAPWVHGAILAGRGSLVCRGKGGRPCRDLPLTRKGPASRRALSVSCPYLDRATGPWPPDSTPLRRSGSAPWRRWPGTTHRWPGVPPATASRFR